MTSWKPIETAPIYPNKKCFLVKAYFEESNYWTDPWTVFRDIDNNFVRWPHDKPPTLWTEIPD